MPRVNNRDGFTKTTIGRNPGMFMNWKWVARDYDEGRKFVVFEVGETWPFDGHIALTEENVESARKSPRNDFGKRGGRYSEATPMLICEEVTS